MGIDDRHSAAWILVLILASFARAEVPTTAPASYTNPLAVDMADPFVIRDRGVYWLYGTTSSREGFKCMVIA